MNESVENEPLVPTCLRDGVVAQLDRFCGHYGESLGHVLWNGEFQDLAIIIADLIEADLAIWMAEAGSLVPVFNGPRAESLVGRYRCPLDAGVLGQVYVMEQSCGGEADAESGRLIDAEMDRLLGLRSVCYLAAPLYFGASLRGVVSAVRFIDLADPDPPAPPPFNQGEMLRFESMTRTLGKVYDELILSRTFDL